MKNNEITIKAEKNGLLPVVDAYAFYGGSELAGSQNPSQNCGPFGTGQVVACTPTNGGVAGPISYGTAFGNLFNNSAPDKGVGVNITIPLRNRVAQADQARSQMEYRQAQMRLQQLYHADPDPGDQCAVCADQRQGPGCGGTGGAGLCCAESGC